MHDGRSRIIEPTDGYMIDFDGLLKHIIQDNPFERCNETVEFTDNNMVLNMTLPRGAWYIKKMDGKFRAFKDALRKRTCVDAVVWMKALFGNIH